MEIPPVSGSQYVEGPSDKSKNDFDSVMSRLEDEMSQYLDLLRHYTDLVMSKKDPKALAQVVANLNALKKQMDPDITRLEKLCLNQNIEVYTDCETFKNHLDYVMNQVNQTSTDIDQLWNDWTASSNSLEALKNAWPG